MFSFPLTNNCFDSALDYLEWLEKETFHFRKMKEDKHNEIWPLEVDLKVLRFLVSYVRLQSNGFFFDNDEEDIGTGGYNNPHFILPIIEDVVSRIPTDIHSAYLTSGSDGASIEANRCRDDIKFFATLINQICISLLPNNKAYCREDVKFFGTVINHTCICLLANKGCCPLGHHHRLMDVFHSLEHCSNCGRSWSFHKDLKMFRTAFIASLIGFATLQGVDRMLLIGLLTQLEVAAGDAVSKIYAEWFDRDRCESQQNSMAAIADPQLSEAYIHILTASKLSKASTNIFRKNKKEEEKKKHQQEEDGEEQEENEEEEHGLKVAKIFIDSLLEIHMKLTYSSPTPMADQKRNHERGLRFLSILLMEKHKEFTSLDDELKDLIGAVLIDAAILIFSLSSDELHKGLTKESDLAFSHCHRVVECILSEAVQIHPPPFLSSSSSSSSSSFSKTITKEINSPKTKVLDYMTNVDTPDQPEQRVTKTCSHMPSQVSASAPEFNEFLVGLHEEQNKIIDKLTRGSNKLEIFSIVGMPGIGKTTLANKVYNHLSIAYRFHFRAWCTVSQVHSKRDMLLQILGDVVSKNHKMDENDLAEKLYKHLKGKMYLIVLDDVWQVDAFNLLQHSFPDDNNGSRLLITSRYHELFSKFENHYLRLLTDEESWKLLKTKVFGEKPCSVALEILGKQIAERCKGLPLTIIIIAGVLASNSEENYWENVGKSQSTSTKIQEQCEETLELSYKNLPDHLKPCLLYFGAFREDQDISVQRLLSLWISEGFVQDKEAKSLEEVANEYLMNLIDRSLVMVAKSRSLSGVKTCRVHDLIYEFCVRKAQKESFLQILHGWHEILVSTTLYKPLRLSLYSKDEKRREVDKWSIYFPLLRFHDLHSLLLFSDKFIHVVGYSILFQNFKLLKVLDIRIQHPADNWCTFPEGVLLLVQLRYLAIPCTLESIPSGIADLTCLETLLINDHHGAIKLPNTIWKMKKLRHLNCWNGFIFPTDNLKDAPHLHNLRTCTLNVDDFSSESFHHVLMKFSNIRRLRWCGFKPSENFHVPDSLESLGLHGRHLPVEFVFPMQLKKVTLKYCRRKWSEISAIGKLPNLQVLKLFCDSIVGETWEVKEGEFRELKFLKLDCLRIRKWTFADDDFPRLETLVLRGCVQLEEVPQCLGDIPTLKMIEVTGCSQSAAHSIKQIQEEQSANGNEDVDFIINKFS